MHFASWFYCLCPKGLDPGKSVRELGEAACVAQTVFRIDGVYLAGRVLKPPAEIQPGASFFVFLFCWPEDLGGGASLTEPQLKNDAVHCFRCCNKTPSFSRVKVYTKIIVQDYSFLLPTTH